LRRERPSSSERKSGRSTRRAECERCSAKEADPIWQPPEWLYAETALENGLKLGHLNSGEKIKLRDGRYLTVRDGVAGVVDGGMFAALPTDEHIVFDNTLFVPPMGSKNRKIEGELGKYRLNLATAICCTGPVQGVDRSRRDARLRAHARRRHRMALRPRAGRNTSLHLLIRRSADGI
jgi:hypothetical protein